MIVVNMLTANELPYVKNIIPQLREFADEIYVCDDFSTDGTWEWLQEQKDLKIFRRKCDFDIVGQRNYLLNKTPKDCWVLIVSPDEVLTFGFRFRIKDLIGSLTTPPEVNRVFVYVYNLRDNLNSCDEEICAQTRMFWNSDKHNAKYVYLEHEELTGNWSFESAITKGEGIVHLKLLDKQKLNIGRTDYVKKGVYAKDNIGELLESHKVINLPETVGFEISNELVSYLGLAVNCA